MCKPHQILAPQTRNAKNPPLNRPSKYKAIRLAQSILKRKFPSVDRPLQNYAPQKSLLKNISPGAYFLNFALSKWKNENAYAN